MTTYIPSLTLPSAVFEQPAVSVLVPLALGLGVGYSTRPTQAQKLARELRQPPGHPPPQYFGPVWSFLYASMGYAAYRAWTAGMESFDVRKVQLAKQGATLYTIQLGLNLIWMPLFFRLGRPVEASVDIVALTGITAYLAYIWGQVDEVAGWLLVPYIGWLSFATYLSVGVGHLNHWDFEGKEKDAAREAKKEE
ncbi:hypothetical protein W97_01300 [Coniosporium apollinis CBS 100218]|uniref:Benzodiazapine receptor n=1 Tax=Coniosporium apollinis (strain CBS 100218) TaxID=1168221 RepID=R7YKF1_CONA1|nr:uncharacterized protein W97_01300 [Coniosporium apollinis CBS 100218]EON62081.1 hypothetical protein W97_01300 [Coniosporium apollinis CBS 100218]